VGWRCCRIFFGEYFEELVIFRRNFIFADLGVFLDFVDDGLAYLSWVRFANLPIFRCFPVLLLDGLFLWDRVRSW